MAEVVRGDIHNHFHQTNMLAGMREGHVTIEAEFDSSDREYAPRCHQGTRTRFLDELMERIHSAKRITWVFGPAGVGKSAIMQTLAETLSDTRTFSNPSTEPALPSVTCLSFFFSRPNRRNDPKKVFPTLAYRLAIANPEYRWYLEGNLATDPNFLAKTLDEQFKRLFVDPFATKSVDAFHRCVIFLDGLDEADGSAAQRRILGLIQGSIIRHKILDVPISWVIASRPEPHLRASFSQMEEEISCVFSKVEIPIDSDEAVREMEIYIRAAFSRIRRDFSDMVPCQWPPEADLLKITTTSSGLFVFGSTCMGYIGDQNPVQRLKHVVELIDHYRAKSGSSRPDLSRNPFQILDDLYRTILSDVPDNILPMTKVILGFHLLDKQVIGQPSFKAACQLLNFDRSDAYAALRGLHSVLSCPPQDDSKTPLKFLHASFPDFLKDRSRSREYWVDIGEEMRKCRIPFFGPSWTNILHFDQ